MIALFSASSDDIRDNDRKLSIYLLMPQGIGVLTFKFVCLQKAGKYFGESFVIRN